MTLIQTDIYLGQNKIDLALKTIGSPARIMPENRALNYKWAEVLIRQNQTTQAESILKDFLQKNPRDLSAWNLMQQAANVDRSSALRTVNVLRYRAEVQYWSGWEEEAIKSLLHAQRLAKDNQAMSANIKNRVTEMQRERQLKI